MKDRAIQFEEYKLIHGFLYPDSPLKKWLNKDNFCNADEYEIEWEELMELVGLIESNTELNGKGYSMQLLKNFCTIIDGNTLKRVFNTINGDTRKDATYSTCIKFIKFYNALK
jgi:hypothetical protein